MKVVRVKVVIMLLSMVTLLMACSNVVKRGAIVEAQDALNKNNFSEVLEYTDIAESFGDPLEANVAKLHYLRAQALEGLGRMDEASHGYRYVTEQYARSVYAGPSQQRLDALSTD